MRTAFILLFTCVLAYREPGYVRISDTPPSSHHSCLKLIEAAVAHAKTADKVGQFKYASVSKYLEETTFDGFTSLAPQNLCQNVKLELSSQESRESVLANGKKLFSIWKGISDTASVKRIKHYKKWEKRRAAIVKSLIPFRGLKYEVKVGTQLDETLQAMYQMAVRTKKKVYTEFNDNIVVISPTDTASTNEERDIIYERYVALSKLDYPREYKQERDIAEIASKAVTHLQVSIGLFISSITPWTTWLFEVKKEKYNPLMAAVQQVTNEPDAIAFAMTGLRETAYKPTFLKNLGFSAEYRCPSEILENMWINLVKDFEAKNMDDAPIAMRVEE